MKMDNYQHFNRVWLEKYFSRIGLAWLVGYIFFYCWIYDYGLYSEFIASVLYLKYFI